VKRLLRAVFFVLVFFAPATYLVPHASAKAIPASAQQNQSKRRKKSKAKNSIKKTKATKSRPLQRRQRKQRSKPA
jgi:hypothetical protein